MGKPPLPSEECFAFIEQALRRRDRDPTDPFPMPIGDLGWAERRYGGVKYEDFYQDDRYRSGAALWLHPLLDPPAGKTWAKGLDGMGGVAYVPGRLVELGPAGKPPDAIHLLIGGRGRLVTRTEPERYVEIGQVGPGQWIGLVGLLRAYQGDGALPAAGWPAGLEVDVRPVTLFEGGRCGFMTQRIDIAHALELMKTRPDFRRFVEHHAAIRFGARPRMLKLIEDNPILRLLDPPDREYFLQLGAWKRSVSPDCGSQPYMRAGVPSHRVALLLSGKASAFFPTSSGSSFVGDLRPGDLIGHEGLVMDAERASTPPSGALVIAEPLRLTEICLSPGAEVLELNWFAFRWIVDGKPWVWDHVVELLTGPACAPSPLPTVVAFYGKSGTGNSILSYGAAATLAKEEPEKDVWLVDLQGQANYDRFVRKGGSTERKCVDVLTAVREQRVGSARARASRVAYTELCPHVWPPNLRVVWPREPTAVEKQAAEFLEGPEATEQLVELALASPRTGTILVSAKRLPIGSAGASGEGAVDSDETTRLAGLVDGRCATVFYCTDEPDYRYPHGAVEPAKLTWVHRMNPRYLQTVAEAATRKREVDGASQPRPKDGEDDGGAGQRPRMRRVVRVPDDRNGGTRFVRGELMELLAEGRASPLVRAIGRVARVVQGRSVGLALGGGAAWGMAHVSMIEALEKAGVPIDFICGSSAGSTIGGIYAAGGLHPSKRDPGISTGLQALKQLLSDNHSEAPELEPGAWLNPFRWPLVVRATYGALRGGLTRAALRAIWDTRHLSDYVDEFIRGYTPHPWLQATEIPFAPVATDLEKKRELYDAPVTMGKGVVLSGSLPPGYSAASWEGRAHVVVDGAVIANVPSRVARQVMGADFVIAVNCVPPDGGYGKRGFRMIGLSRLSDAVRSFFVLSWKAGEDQAERFADRAVPLEPKTYQMQQVWRGKEIADQVMGDCQKEAQEILRLWTAFGRQG
jgi:predicted acylesterase/phospholipase RssA/CRP-like cAMP-binding protein